MNFELGKEYIVKVSEKGIVPIEEFDKSRWYDKDHDDLDFLTGREKIVVVNQVLDKIRAEIEHLTIAEGGDDYVRKMAELFSLKMKVLQIIDKYKE